MRPRERTAAAARAVRRLAADFWAVLCETARGAVALAVLVLPDVVGIAGYALICVGIYKLAGEGWTYVAAGAPLAVGYVWRETLARRRT